MFYFYFYYYITCYFRPRDRETRRSRSKGVTAFFPDDVEAFTYPVFERIQMSKKPDKISSDQIHANGNQVSCNKINRNLNIRIIYNR